MTFYSSNDTWMSTFYATGSDYGYLDGEYNAWDLRKDKGGGLYLNNNTTYFVKPEGTSNMNAATFAGRVTAVGFTSTSSNVYTGGMSSFETTLTNNEDWENSPISILERGNVGSTQSADKYAPNLNFHWSSAVSKSL